MNSSSPLLAHVREVYLSAHPMARKEAISLTELKATLAQMPISQLGLSNRARGRLLWANITTVGQLVDCTEVELLSIWHMGQKTAQEILNKLKAYLSAIPLRDGHIALEPLPPSNESRYEREKPSAEPPLSVSGAIEQLLSMLTMREAKVLRLRYGLEDGQVRTLEDVGREFDVTRERIRQIQAKVLNRLRHPTKKKYLDVISSSLVIILKEAGGILRESDVHCRLAEVAYVGDFHPAGIARFIFQLSPKFLEVEDEVWALANAPLKHIPTVIEHAVRLLKSHRARMRFNALVSQIKCAPTVIETVPTLDTLFVEACIKASPEIEVTSGGWCGLTRWRASYLDEVVEVLRSEGKPLHYSAITKRVNELLGDKQVAERNIHALLQREKSVFVRVDPGTYGLLEWGLKRVPYFLKLIEDAFQKAGKPLTSSEVMTCVSKVRACKESTILMYLTLNERFVRLESGEFVLREWFTEKEEEQSKPLSHLTVSFVEQLKEEAMAELSTGLKSINPEHP